MLRSSYHTFLCADSFCNNTPVSMCASGWNCGVGRTISIDDIWQTGVFRRSESRKRVYVNQTSVIDEIRSSTCHPRCWCHHTTYAGHPTRSVPAGPFLFVAVLRNIVGGKKSRISKELFGTWSEKLAAWEGFERWCLYRHANWLYPIHLVVRTGLCQKY